MLVDKTGKDTRTADKQVIDAGLRSKDPNVRRQANYAREKIIHEDRKTEMIRRDLVKAHREGNQGRIKDIGDHLVRSRKKTSFYF